MSEITHATDATFDALLREPGLTVVDFWATWCAPCRMIAPALEKIAAERDDVRVVKLDTDANAGVMTRYAIRSIPTLLFFRDGALVDRVVGAVGRDRISRVIDQHVSVAA